MTVGVRLQLLVVVVLLLAAGSFTAAALFHARGIEPEALPPPTDAAVAGRFPFPAADANGPDCPAAVAGDPARLHAAWESWKAHLVTRQGAGGRRRVMAPEYTWLRPNASLSHTTAYGMLLAAYFDDRALFDDLYAYARRWANKRSGLMHWYIDPEGRGYCPDMVYCGSSSDADQDMAYALILADVQWGEQVGDFYRQAAARQIERIRRHDIDETLVIRPGDSWGRTDSLSVSHFKPAYYRRFGEYSGDPTFWNQVLARNWEIFQATLNADNGNLETGLMPTWSLTDGRAAPAYTTTLADGTVVEAPTHYEFGAARVPFQMAQYACWRGDPAARAYVERVAGFFARLGVPNIVSGYLLDGTPHPKTTGEGAYHATLFYGTAAAAASLFPQYAEFVRDAHAALLAADVAQSYYESTWRLLNLMFIEGAMPDLVSLLEARRGGTAAGLPEPAWARLDRYAPVLRLDGLSGAPRG
ncbi:MAG: hypothetical protein KatS3mg121_1183 [Gammaproteobacteria bacterium]|nr:MAG: hypothetical protein KatS3mg121_1183 [Gammaproteobacteria bacterium]